METNPVIPESFIGDIRKVADEVKRLSEGVACLPGDIAKIPAESFALFTQLRDEFDKAHVIRNRLLQALEDAERIVGGVLDAVEKAGACVADLRLDRHGACRRHPLARCRGALSG